MNNIELFNDHFQNFKKYLSCKAQLIIADPPLQWNETTSQREMLTDVREWLHTHHPEWRRAMVYLSHYNGTHTYSDAIQIERGQIA